MCLCWEVLFKSEESKKVWKLSLFTDVSTTVVSGTSSASNTLQISKNQRCPCCEEINPIQVKSYIVKDLYEKPTYLFMLIYVQFAYWNLSFVFFLFFYRGCEAPLQFTFILFSFFFFVFRVLFRKLISPKGASQTWLSITLNGILQDTFLNKETIYPHRSLSEQLIMGQCCMLLHFVWVV